MQKKVNPSDAIKEKALKIVYQSYMQWCCLEYQEMYIVFFGGNNFTLQVSGIVKSGYLPLWASLGDK